MSILRAGGKECCGRGWDDEAVSAVVMLYAALGSVALAASSPSVAGYGGKAGETQAGLGGSSGGIHRRPCPPARPCRSPGSIWPFSSGSRPRCSSPAWCFVASVATAHSPRATIEDVYSGAYAIASHRARDRGDHRFDRVARDARQTRSPGAGRASRPGARPRGAGRRASPTPSPTRRRSRCSPSSAASISGEWGSSRAMIAGTPNHRLWISDSPTEPGETLQSAVSYTARKGS